jgi:hypothetical protein
MSGQWLPSHTWTLHVGHVRLTGVPHPVRGPHDRHHIAHCAVRMSIVGEVATRMSICRRLHPAHTHTHTHTHTALVEPSMLHCNDQHYTLPHCPCFDARYITDYIQARLLANVRSALLWDVTQRWVEVRYRRFGQPPGPIFKGRESQKKGFFWCCINCSLFQRFWRYKNELWNGLYGHQHYAWLQHSAAMQMRTAPLWDIPKRWVTPLHVRAVLLMHLHAACSITTPSPPAATYVCLCVPLR